MQGRERQALWDIHHRKHFETGFLLAGKLHILKQIFSLTITIRCQVDVLSLLRLLLCVLVRSNSHFLTKLIGSGLKKGKDGLQSFLFPCDGEALSENFSDCPSGHKKL